MQTDFSTGGSYPYEPAGTSTLERGLDVLVADMAAHLGCADFPPAPDGHCELVLDDNRSLSIWPRPDGSGLLLMADLPLPEGVDMEAAYRAALAYCMGAASIDAPVIGMNEDATLSLMWAMAAQGGPDHAADGISFFLENLTLADTVLTGAPVEAEAAAPAPAADLDAAPGEAVLQAISEALELEETIEFDEDGFGTFQTSDGSLVLLQYSRERGRIALMAQVGSIAEGEEELCLRALEYNFSAAGDDEPVLGLDGGRGGLFLITTLGAKDSAAAEVEPVLELFLNRYANCRGAVHDPDYEEEQLEAEAEAEAAAAENSGAAAWEPSFTGIRV